MPRQFDDVFKVYSMVRLMILLGLLAASTTEAAVVAIEWSKESRYEHQTKVPAGQFVELCAELPAGQEIRWQFNATGPLDFDIHYHADKSVIIPAKLTQTSGSDGILATAVAQDYCWMWVNRSSAIIELRTRLKK